MNRQQTNSDIGFGFMLGSVFTIVVILFVFILIGHK